MSGSRKIAYILGAGFSFGTGHQAPVGRHRISMPLQLTLLEELCRFHYRKIDRLDSVTKTVRRYFSPKRHRAARTDGSPRHADLFGLSVEEIVTFLDEIVSKKMDGYEKIAESAKQLHEFTVELVSFLSIHGSPGKNSLLRRFRNRILQTDVILSFNWDTLLDRVLASHPNLNWHPAYGYGSTVRKIFDYAANKTPRIPNKYPKPQGEDLELLARFRNLRNNNQKVSGLRLQKHIHAVATSVDPAQPPFKPGETIAILLRGTKRQTRAKDLKLAQIEPDSEQPRLMATIERQELGLEALGARDVIKTCRRYLRGLEQLVSDCQKRFGRIKTDDFVFMHIKMPKKEGS